MISQVIKQNKREKMGYENDFVEEVPVELNIEGRKFKYKPTTGGDENEWLKDVMELDPVTKKGIVNWSVYNRKKLENITTVPYDLAIIKKIVGVEKEWKDLNADERYKLLAKLRPGLFDKIMNAMKAIDEPDLKTIKNSQG